MLPHVALPGATKARQQRDIVPSAAAHEAGTEPSPCSWSCPSSWQDSRSTSCPWAQGVLCTRSPLPHCGGKGTARRGLVGGRAARAAGRKSRWEIVKLCQCTESEAERGCSRLIPAVSYLG